MTREEAKAVVEKLVNRFAEQRNGYHAADYNETKTRRDFIDPLFTAFGWDMDNDNDVAEPYREVIHEDKVKIQGKTKAPDYGFRLSGSKDRLFFVEAKKPSVALKANKEAAFQVRRYGWNSGASVSILTNFEEFIIYDCSKKPSSTESSAVARLKYFTYDQLLKEFDFFYDIFSREAVVKGRFDNYVKSDIAKKGTQTPDKEFVESLNKWRKYIAIDIARSNLKLNEDELNFAVQLIIDRLIFLRFCEDRGVETYGQLKAAASKGDAYKNLCGVFKDADNKYNSGLFDFKKDQITQGLKVTNKIIKVIIEELYYPKSEYDFKALPVEVLGNAYEQFLGKVITINRVHHAVIDYKPEVKKAGGVYYTPQYIVDYIVENTLGKLIKNKTPKEVEKIKIVDPACGSGSFLLGAFQYLLNFHADYYHKNGYANKKGKDNPLTPHGTLSTAEKKKILLNNVYGVDIDANAVEVTKLSLLLKCMEGETDASIKQQITMFHERVLPDLDDNVRDGNSLINTDFYTSKIELGFEKKIKPFNWKEEFPKVFKQGGFDIVIGNPPYVFTRDVEFGNAVKDYYKSHYLNNISKSVKSKENQTGKANLYSLFVVKGVQLLNEQGLMGYIIPNTILRTTIYESVRKYLLDNTSIETIVDLKAGVFDGVTASTVLLFLGQDKAKKEILVIDNPAKEKSITAKPTKVTKDTFLNNPSYSFNIFSESGDNILFDKIRKKSIELSTIIDVFNGIATYKEKQGISKTKKNNTYKKLLSGKDIARYSHDWRGEYIEYVPEKLQRARDESIFIADEKLIMQRIGGILITSYDDKQYYTFNSVNNILSKPTSTYSLKFILALLNSKFLRFYYRKNFTNNSTLTVNISKTFLDKLPIPKILFDNKASKGLHDDIVKHADALLKLNEEIKGEKLPNKIHQLKQKIKHILDTIDELIFKFYELSPEDVKSIEEGGA